MLSNSSKDLVVALGFSLVALLLAAYFDANESFIEWSEQYEEIELDELPIAAAAIALAMAWFSWRRWRDLQSAQHALKRRLIEIEQLKVAEQQGKQRALEKSRQLTVVGRMTEALLISESEEEAVRVFQSYACDLAQSNAGAVVLSDRSESSQTVCQWGGQSDRFEALDFEKCWSHRSNKIYDTEMGICERSCGGVPQRQLCVPVSNAADCHGVIAVELNGADEAQLANVSEALTPAASVLAITISNLGLRNDLFHQSIKDPLTGLLNRRGWQEKIKRIVAEDAKDSSLSIINIDIDDFKKINDRMGHEAGDRVLVILARIIEENTRSVDLACRLGGDEILLLLPEMNRKQAMDKAELIADLFKSQCRQQFGGDSVTFSLSSGVACCPDDGSTISELVARSDNYLYSAKHRGKNQIAAG